MPEIWHLRTHKIRLQRRQKEQRRFARRELLSKIFAAWRHPGDHITQNFHYNFDLTLCLSQMKVSIELRQVAHRLRRMLTRAKSTAVHAAIEALPADGAASQILCNYFETSDRLHQP